MSVWFVCWSIFAFSVSRRTNYDFSFFVGLEDSKIVLRRSDFVYWHDHSKSFFFVPNI